MIDVVSQLVALGIDAQAASNKAALFTRAEHALGGMATKRWHVPGRIEVVGKHTDYAGGRSLLCAAERGICVATSPRRDSLVRVTDAIRGEVVEFPLSADIEVPKGWANYVATVIRRVARNFPGISQGVDIALASDLAQSAGLSSSSALVIAIFTAIAAANHLAQNTTYAECCGSGEELAAYLACIENGQSYRTLAGDLGVGTFGGSEDHTAILCCRAGRLSQYRFCPVVLEEQFAMPDDWQFVIAASGIQASKTAAARDRYNHASLAARAVLDVWNAASRRADPTLYAALRRTRNAADEIRACLTVAQSKDFSTVDLVERFEHYLVESQQLVPAASAAFAAHDTAKLGAIVDRSQSAAEQWLGNQVPETVALARSARKLGAIAASAFGAGFGGSVWALVQRHSAHEFMKDWRSRYTLSFPEAAEYSTFFTTRAGPGLREV